MDDSLSISAKGLRDNNGYTKVLDRCITILSVMGALYLQALQPDNTCRQKSL